jgi:hypothetical protein
LDKTKIAFELWSHLNHEGTISIPYGIILTLSVDEGQFSYCPYCRGAKKIRLAGWGGLSIEQW